MRIPRLTLVVPGLLLFSVVCTSLFAQESDKMSYASLKESKFAANPALPSCVTAAVQHGDPLKGAAILVGKVTAGCNIPWHWHTYAENLVLISGSGKAEMKDGTTHVLRSGDFAHLPGKQTHQFTCPVACTLYIMPEGAFDIHYVDKDGKEIPLEQAVKTPAKAAPKKKAAQ